MGVSCPYAKSGAHNPVSAYPPLSLGRRQLWVEGKEILALNPLQPVLRPALALVLHLNLVKQEDDKETLSQ